MALPTHLQVGRGSFPGPLTGGYTCLAMPCDDVAISQTTQVFGWLVLPFDFRIEMIVAQYSAVAGTAVEIDAIEIQDTIGAIGSGTNVVATNTDWDANNPIIYRPNGETPRTTNLQSAGRNVQRAQFLVAYVTTDGASTVTTPNIFVYGFPYNHANLSKEND